MSDSLPPPEPKDDDAAQIELRRRAETRAEAGPSEEPATPCFHELRVHQIELEMQNEELRRAQIELEASRARYFELYDLAPVGFCTFDEAGTIEEANITAARMFGVTKQELIGRALTDFVHFDSQDAFYVNCRRFQASMAPHSFELKLKRGGDGSFWAWVEIHAVRAVSGAMARQIAFSDITLLKQPRSKEAGRQE